MAYKKTTAVGSGLRTFLGLALLTGGFLASLATILGFFGSTSWFFDVLANFRFQFAIALFVIGVIYLVAFGRATAFVFVAMGVVNAVVVAPMFLGSPAPASGDASIRIASFNVGAGRADAEEIADWMADSPLDLVFLLESSEEWIAALPTAGSGFSVENEIPEDRAYGISVLGRKAGEIEQLRLGVTKDPVVRVEVTIADQPVAVYAVHPRPPSSARHADARNSLFEELADLIDRERMPVVVIGDFNATPWSSTFRAFESRTGLINSQQGYGLAPTWPTSLPLSLIPIDHMMHSDALTTIAREVGPDLGSDHRPLTVEVAIAAN